jgi:hypothetical protein
MGLLSDAFQFTQSSLQDYDDCPRRFQLRYIHNQRWPAVESQSLLEYERYIELGRRFHQMVEQHIAGLPVETLAASLADPDLARWWRNYLNVPPPGVLSLPVRRAEASLSAPVGQYRLAARYDVLAVEPGQRAVIVDWKTERKRPLRAELAARMQTRVYRCVLAKAGQALYGGRPIEPEHVEMIYWFAEFPADPEVLAYDAAQFAQDWDYVSGLIAEIAGRTDLVFPSAVDKRHCRFCLYHSLCQPGAALDSLDPGEPDAEDISLEFDLEEITEIAY